MALEVPQVQPLAGEVAAKGPRALVGEHSFDLLIQSGWIPELALRGQTEQLIVGNAAPDEERQSRSQLQIGDSIRGSGDGVFGVAFAAEQKLGRYQEKCERVLDAGVQAVLLFVLAPIETQQPI